MNWQQHSSGLIVPEEKQKKPSEPAREPITPLVNEPIGCNSDGSFTLCPEVFAVLKELMLRRGLHYSSQHAMRELSDAIYLHQDVSFEEWT